MIRYHVLFLLYELATLVCLSELNDKRNAASAFEKAANMPDVEKYPLALLNFAIFSHQNHNYGPSWRSLDRYMALVDNHKTRNKSNGTVRNVRNREKQMQ